MAKKKTKTPSNAAKNVFKRRGPKDPFTLDKETIHSLGNSHVCLTDSRGYAVPKNADIREIVLDASEGFIPLWAEGMNLRWRFNERSMRQFEDPLAAKDGIRALLAEAVNEWKDSAPVKFTETDDAWDFEVIVRNAEDCDINGCVLASAFFPDAGRHDITIYPTMFQESHDEQVATLAHEIGHVFGLRHFFAKVEEKDYPSVIFGKHRPFSIMNYGEMSKLTAADRSDLKRLYAKVWSGELKAIKGTPIVQVKPYHMR